MAILKSEIRNKFTSIPNSIIQDNPLSDGDFRLLIFLYSLPDKWKINQGYLAKKMNCNRVNVNKKISRIKNAGFLEIVKPDAKENDTDYIYILKESPVSIEDVSIEDVSLIDTHINNNIIKNKEIFSYIEENYSRPLSSYELQLINNWLNIYTDELIINAIEISCKNNKKNLGYVEGILNNWKTAGIKNASEITNISNKSNIDDVKTDYEVGKTYEVDGVKFKINENGKREFL